ncbi:MAG: protein tyrosine phosphatase [Eggerthellaceae bacterium]|nr:protein tyrosine phosphatase [Eggerthellaceae bacterium]
MPITFSGYVDAFDGSPEQDIAAVQFSLDDGAHWTDYPLDGCNDDAGVSWTFQFTPHEPGSYCLHVRALGSEGASSLISSTPFMVEDDARSDARSKVPAPGNVRSKDALSDVLAQSRLRLRAVGKLDPRRARLFRSSELWRATSADADAIDALGISTIYDIRTQREVSKHPDPVFNGVTTVSLTPDDAGRAKNAKGRLVAGVIGEYGQPEERMRHNYRRYAKEYPLMGKALRSFSSKSSPCLVHCVNGKDRTGVVCAVVMRIAGFHEDDIMDDYLMHNTLYADEIQAEEEEMSFGMTDAEKKILRSFIEARPSYLQAFFSEADEAFGSFDRYVSDGLLLTRAQRDSLACALA